MRSGFCNPGNDAASHTRCVVAWCDCTCHPQTGAADGAPGGATMPAGSEPSTSAAPPPVRPWYSAACIGGNPDACPRTNTTGDRTCANPAHDLQLLMADAVIDGQTVRLGPFKVKVEETVPPGVAELRGADGDVLASVQIDLSGPDPDEQPARRRRWRCPKCDQLVFKADHVVGTTFACDQPQGVPDDLHPPGEQTVVPMAGVELPMAVEQHQAQQAAEAVTWPKPAPWEAEALRDTPWDADTEPDGDGDPHDQLAAQANEVAWPDDEHNHEWERTDGVRCCPCGAWIEETPDGPTGVVREPGWQPTPLELTQHERKLVVAAHLVYHPDTILETVREIVEARLQGREANE